ncbi:GDSL esterase/lipase [Cucumis melo var. makuwa]|uniref:GDSL esterase/lipase n=1 Tax=Cucumis melo var. makuwa TaxID=1194695 RepID=A0A5A7TNJ7_CUCMM|nr:GDSL esterase/lipase [Cucumis melo var. makuwa]
MGLTLIGCAPFYLWKYCSENGACIEKINDMVMEFNFAMRYMVEELNTELPDSSIIFCDLLQDSMDISKNNEYYGVNDNLTSFHSFHYDPNLSLSLC